MVSRITPSVSRLRNYPMRSDSLGRLGCDCRNVYSVVPSQSRRFCRHTPVCGKDRLLLCYAIFVVESIRQLGCQGWAPLWRICGHLDLPCVSVLARGELSRLLGYADLSQTSGRSYSALDDLFSRDVPPRKFHVTPTIFDSQEVVERMQHKKASLFY